VSEHEYRKATDEVHEIELPSAISQVMWDRPSAWVGAEVEVHVHTHFVGDGSRIKITVFNRVGVRMDSIEGEVKKNRFKEKYTVSEKAADTIYFEAELPDHDLKERSDDMQIAPPVLLKKLRWSQEEARRGDTLTLTAEVENAPDGSEAKIEIFEHDFDGAHDLVTELSANVENRGLETQWEFEYFEDSDDIPRWEECENGYPWPEYFFKVSLRGAEARSKILKFKDEIHTEFTSDDGSPLTDMDYIVHLPDGEERRGALDHTGSISEEDIPPGPSWIELEDAGQEEGET
jgi:hypothetical protein